MFRLLSRHERCFLAGIALVAFVCVLPSIAQSGSDTGLDAAEPQDATSATSAGAELAEERDPAAAASPAAENPAAEKATDGPAGSDLAPDPVAPPRASRDSKASEAVVQAVQAEQRRLELHLAALESYQLELDDAREDAQARVEEARAFALEQASKLADLQDGAVEVDAVYGSVVAMLTEEQERLGQTLERWRFVSGVPKYKSKIDPRDLDLNEGSPQLETIRQLRNEAKELEKSLRAREPALNLALLDGCADTVARLYELRTDALNKQSRSRRREILGFTAEGFETLKLETQRLLFAARAYGLQAVQRVRELPKLVNDVFAVGRVSWTGIKLLAILVIFFMMRRRWDAIRETLHGWVNRMTASRTTRDRLRRAISASAVVAPWLFLLALIWAARWALGQVALEQEVDLPLRLATLYIVYRLAIDAVFNSAMGLVRIYRLRVDPARTRLILNTVRTVMRAATLILALLLFSRSMLGRGYLYHLVVLAAWVIGTITFLRLLSRWRPIIADAYLNTDRKGRLRDLVESTRDRWYGIFVSAAAFVWLAGAGIAVVVRDFAMEFDHTRQALAFIFRRKMEKQAERSGYADVDLEALPKSLRDAFDVERTVGEELLAEHYPGLDELQELMTAWRAEERRGSFLLSGIRGMGKTSWLRRVDPGEEPLHFVTLRHRIQSESGLVELLARELELELPSPTLNALGKALKDLPPRVIVIDMMQNLFLAKVGGYGLIESFVSLIETTSDRVFWICSISRFACEHLFAVHPELMIFRKHQILHRWSEEEIGALIARRVEAAKIDLDYEALLTERPDRRVHEDRMIETAEGYTRLIWDYSAGNPRVALHFWLRSLFPVSETLMKVKLFRPPDEKELDEVGNRALFLLAAIVVHENLSLREAAQVTRYPIAVCRIQLEHLRGRKMLRVDQGRYRIDTHWHRAIIRILSRNNLLAD